MFLISYLGATNQLLQTRHIAPVRFLRIIHSFQKNSHFTKQKLPTIVSWLLQVYVNSQCDNTHINNQHKQNQVILTATVCCLFFAKFLGWINHFLNNFSQLLFFVCSLVNSWAGLFSSLLKQLELVSTIFVCFLHQNKL